MEKNIIISDWVKAEIGEPKAVLKIRSSEQNKVYKIETDTGLYILKQGPNLAPEKDRLIWLKDKLPVAKFVAWRKTEQNEELIISFIAGDDLADMVKKVSPTIVIDFLVQALKMVHQIDISDCPFGEKGENRVFVHGDACLPNFIIKEDKVVGIIDLRDSRIDNEEVDVAAAVWTLDFNYGPGHGCEFLEKYEWSDVDEAEVNRLIEAYEIQI